MGGGREPTVSHRNYRGGGGGGGGTNSVTQELQDGGEREVKRGKWGGKPTVSHRSYKMEVRGKWREGNGGNQQCHTGVTGWR